ncbi:UDP-2,4-diacetamido-2,4,6-trideoxy-beta-L-altropyranose hydrolase [Hymenobacter aerilatus]|uniref:UDP-2,4-diacetamido-2,4, 6-trideoxy-beta-L-altropyranose hydrolase n=1 Tax=Hymenobacter aerilatus TaxID=2932251 RepID=A0A8T9T2T2_9BACT|nr:UDP-2,4-diacetamido-2,4,6-trideoxy-beta-L-altropyranose hydrolase [Hymenobacter aerilatus]UOR07484.1 UDP-2,4-diacetamido-2,4,6-trideoxy-beta-L-altropyranose hydrolase [Hymenobacter aerilatus]
MNPRLLLRADGNPRIGLGHVMRLLALAEILRDRFKSVFVIQEPDAAVRDLLLTTCDEVMEMPPMPAGGEPAWLRQHALRPTDVLVLDGYDFELTYQQAVRPAVHRLVCLDDLHAFPSLADLVLNPAGGVTKADYELRQPGARLLAGPAYAPLRTAFRDAAALPPTTADTGTVLLCLGGADPTHQTQRAATRLLLLPTVRQVHVVVGSAYDQWESLQQWADDQPRLLLHRNLPAPALRDLMRQCGTAVCSPSTISYEYCAAGGGLLFLLPTATNQHDLDRYLRGAGLALPYLSVGNVLTSPEAERIAEQLREAQHQHFDGLAPQRLRQEFAALLLPTLPLRLRPVVASDSDQLLAWANEPAVRQYSFIPTPIERADHERWFANRLHDKDSLLLLAEDETTHEPAGLIRFMVDESTALLSYLLAATHRGRGLAAGLLVAGVRALQQQFPEVRRVEGQVLAANVASVRAFERAGFVQQTATNTSAENYTFIWHIS